MTQRQSSKIERVCPICGSAFRVDPSQIKYGRGIYCSVTCQGAGRRSGAEGRFWSRVDRSGGPSACWPFMGCRDSQGYGKLVIAGTGWLAHRYASTLADGPIPEGIQVLHHCDNPPCCNPAHHFRGSNNDNVADREAKGRTSTSPRNVGSKHPLSKLTEVQVREMRERYQPGYGGYTRLAREYGVSPKTVGQIVKGKRWVHVMPRPDDELRP